MNGRHQTGGVLGHAGRRGGWWWMGWACLNQRGRTMRCGAPGGNAGRPWRPERAEIKQEYQPGITG